MNLVALSPSGALLLAGGSDAALAQRPPSLREAYGGAFRMGIAENVMKAGPINPRPGVYAFGPADAFVDFGGRNGVFIVGHTLVWHDPAPAWFFRAGAGAPNPPAAPIERMRAPIEAAIGSFVAPRVKVRITELDVDVLPLTREGPVIGTVMGDPRFQLAEFEAFVDRYRDGLPAEVQRRLADRYAELFGTFYRKRDRIDRVTLRGEHDGASWKNNYPVPRRANYALLFGRDRRPKPAYDAVLAAPTAEGRRADSGRGPPGTAGPPARSGRP